MKAHEIALLAADLVRGERQEQYGPPEESLARVAALWQTYLNVRRVPGHPLTAEDVALMLALLKLARTQGTPHADSYVDLAGYAALAGAMALGD